MMSSQETQAKRLLSRWKRKQIIYQRQLNSFPKHFTSRNLVYINMAILLTSDYLKFIKNINCSLIKHLNTSDSKQVNVLIDSIKLSLAIISEKLRHIET
jgi:hypothetical protein